MAIYKLPLDDELDKDIIDWIASFPRNRKSEVVRQVLKSHINGEVAPNYAPPINTEKVDKPQQEEKEEQAEQLEKPNRFDKFKDNMEVINNKPKDLSGILA